MLICFHRSISMVHARAFSFTDDSTSVALPSMSAPLHASDPLNSLTGPHSMETSHLLFQLRRAQSSWYQELFQSSRAPLPQTSNYVWQMCQEMREWSESFPDSLPLAFKDFFDLELLYSYVYCLAPSCRVRIVPDYGKNLIFEYCIAYMQKIFPISKDPINTAFYTFHDALRVYFIGSQLMAVLSQNQDQLLKGSLSLYASVNAGSPSPPPLPGTSGGDNVDRSINCINHIKETLRTFGERWEDSKALQSSFEHQAESLLALLQQRRLQGQERPPTNRSPNYLQQQQTSYDNMGSLLAGEWNNMNSMFTNPDVIQQSSAPGS